MVRAVDAFSTEAQILQSRSVDADLLVQQGVIMVYTQRLWEMEQRRLAEEEAAAREAIRLAALPPISYEETIVEMLVFARRELMDPDASAQTATTPTVTAPMRDDFLAVFLLTLAVVLR